MNDISRQFIILILYLSLTTAIGLYLISASKVTSIQYLLCGLGFVFLTPFCEFTIEAAKDVISLVCEAIDDWRK